MRRCAKPSSRRRSRKAREVLVRIERCGLCHSDLHIQDGYADLGGGKRLDTTRGMTLPFTLGHEIAGVVEEVGPEVSKDLIGAKKAVFPWIGCGQCRDCANGDENLCAQAALSRRLHRRRLRHPCAGAGRKIPAGLRSAAGQSGRDPDVLRRHRLWRAEAAGRPAAAAQSAADRPRRRRHDGTVVRAGHVQAEDLGRRFEPGRARGGAEERRRCRLRSRRKPTSSNASSRKPRAVSTRSSISPATRNRWRLRSRWSRAAARSWSPD